MSNSKKEKIKEILVSNPDSIIFYHEHNEWTIYHYGEKGKEKPTGDINNELLDGNDYHNARGYAPELVVALAEMLGIRVKSNDRSRL